MVTTAAHSFVNGVGGFILNSLCGFTLGGFTIGASSIGLARRRPPVAEDPDQGEDDADQLEATEQAIEPDHGED